MVAIDPEEERRRLAESYAVQTDGELENVATQADELTDIARETLRAELVKRGLYAGQMEEPVPGQELAEFRELVTIRQFRDLPEALFAKGSLESAGIECALADDNMVRLDWFISNLLGGVKLQVAPEDAAIANEILSQPIPEDFDAAGTGEYHQPACPKCGSLDIAYRELNKPVAYVSAYIGLPLPVRRQAWRCHNCNAEWEDDGESATTESGSPGTAT